MINVLIVEGGGVNVCGENTSYLMYKLSYHGWGGGCSCHLNPGPYYVLSRVRWSNARALWRCGVVGCFPSPCCGHHRYVPCVCLCVLQMRAASTVTSWSNQTPTALPNVPPPLQVGSASDQQVHKLTTHPTSTHTFADGSCTQIDNCKLLNCLFSLIDLMPDILNLLLCYVCGNAFPLIYPSPPHLLLIL